MNEKAIEELEKIKKWCEGYLYENFTSGKPEKYLGQRELYSGGELTLGAVIEMLGYQIKDLKEEIPKADISNPCG